MNMSQVEQYVLEQFLHLLTDLSGASRSCCSAGRSRRLPFWSTFIFSGDSCGASAATWTIFWHPKHAWLQCVRDRD